MKTVQAKRGFVPFLLFSLSAGVAPLSAETPWEHRADQEHALARRRLTLIPISLTTFLPSLTTRLLIPPRPTTPIQRSEFQIVSRSCAGQHPSNEHAISISDTRSFPYGRFTNRHRSSPFLRHHYEPELIFTIRRRTKLRTLTLRQVDLAVDHGVQSDSTIPILAVWKPGLRPVSRG